MAPFDAQDFAGLTPDKLLSHVATLGWSPTGMCHSLRSLENRVYKIDCEDNAAVVVKCYRPNRWATQQIAAEHRYLQICAEQGLPVIAPFTLPNGETVYQDDDGLIFAFFPWAKGRSPDEFTLPEYEQLGRLLGRLHDVGGNIPPLARPTMHVGEMGDAAVQILLSFPSISDYLKPKMLAIWQALRPKLAALLDAQPRVLLHGDCHRGNVLRYQDKLVLLDFDDAMYGPMEQDIWLLLPGRPSQCPDEFAALLQGYRIYMPKVEETALLGQRIEALRTLRYLRYAAWVVERWQDPSFPIVFSHFNNPATLEQLLLDLQEQYGQLE